MNFKEANAPVNVALIFQDDKISRILSSKPLKIVRIDFDDKSKEEDNADYLEYLEMSLPNEIKFNK
jgi:hypothetical protein